MLYLTPGPHPQLLPLRPLLYHPQACYFNDSHLLIRSVSRTSIFSPAGPSFITVALITSFDLFSTHFVAPVFASEMSFSSVEPAMAAAATANLSNVHLDAFNDDNVEQGYVSHQTQFDINRVSKQIDKYSLACAQLPRSITDIYPQELEVCCHQDDAYDALRSFIVSQFSRSKWAAYFELLRLPCAVEDIKPTEVLAKLKRHLPSGQIVKSTCFLQCSSFVCPPRSPNK